MEPSTRQPSEASESVIALSKDVLVPRSLMSGRWLIRFRIPLLTLAHVFIFAASYFSAYALRLDFSFSQEMKFKFLSTLPVVVGLEIGCFLFFRTFHGWWRHVTFRDLLSFIRPLLVSTMLIVVADVFLLQASIPRSVIVINLMTSGLLMAMVRSSWRLAKEGLWPGVYVPEGCTAAFMISNSYNSLILASQINSQQNSATKVVGILGDSQELSVGSQRAGIPFVGSMFDAPALAAQYNVQEIWLTAGALSGSELLTLKKICDQHHLKTKIVPAAIDRAHGGSFIPVREIDINDLLQRDSVELDERKIASEITGKCVMVTGAGGSIGSEICRQLMKFQPRSLILVDHRENSVFLIHSELNRLDYEGTTLHPAVADILDRPLLESLFSKFKPDFVYHAAAHKHVGLMERQPGVAVRNNVVGTRELADVADKFGATKFVMVSTDKAVNPTSVMGCTKQIAERYCLTLGQKSKTKFVVVRFGNVLGSNGSVVPIFKEQIQRGGPITITDERMTRFFMTIPEASQLVLQAGSMGVGGEIFVLDMGEQVKIVDLAKKMIQLAGLPKSAIDIEYVGARPGEKLYEELYFKEEEMIPTVHHKIFAAKHRTLTYESVLSSVLCLQSACRGERVQVLNLLKTYIPEYAYSPTQKMPAPHLKSKSHALSSNYSSV